jgi:hypothetical protein
MAIETKPQTGRKFHEAWAVEFSIFLANRVGKLKELLDMLAAAGLDLLGMSIVDATDWAVVRAVFSQPDKARAVLKERSLPFTESQVLLATLARSTSLVEICTLLLGAEISVHFAFPLTVRRDDKPVMVLHVDNNELAREILARHGVLLLGDDDLDEIA